MQQESTFKERVRAAVARIPGGRAATYGQIAELAGCPGAARAVGNAIHDNDDPAKVPCHRVVDASGRPGSNYGMGGPAVQLERLRAEGVKILDDGRVDLGACGISIETHPLEPFLHADARILFLGSFPPPRARWSMDFFYPNFTNDFWRIMGLLTQGDRGFFEVTGEKRFDREKIVRFSLEQGFAFFDTALKVCRLKGNASDDWLEIVETSDVPGMLAQMPACRTIVTTGGKASETLSALLEECTGEAVELPKVGGSTPFRIHIGEELRQMEWLRMPSSSRAYPMKLERKADYYRCLL